MRVDVMSFLFCLVSISSFAQKVERVVIKAGPQFFESLKQEVYLYPSFADGVVHFKNGEVYPARMNYHKGSEQIHLLNNTDTVALIDLYEVNHVIINTDTLLYNGRFIMLIHRSGSLLLGKQGRVRTAKKDEKVAYRRIPPPGSSSESYTAFGMVRLGNVDGKRDLPLIKYTTFYIGNRHRQFTKVTRKNILYMFPGKEHLVNNYLTQHSIDLTEETDLKQLLGYLGTLR